MADRLSVDVRVSALLTLRGWSDVQGRDAIQKSFKFKSFSEAFVDQSNLKIHYELCRLPLAGFAHAEKLFPHGIKQRPDSLDDGFVSQVHP